MSNQTKDPIEEILLRVLPVEIHLVKPGGRFSQSDDSAQRVDINAHKRQKALAAINKEIERIGLEVIGKEEDDKYWTMPRPGLTLDPVKVGRNELRAEMHTRLTQALKGREGES